jgi:hypothetical protein
VLGVTSPGTHESPKKEPVTLGTDSCFYPSKRSKNAQPGSWTEEFKYNAKKGLGAEFSHKKCISAAVSASLYQNQKLILENVRVFSGLGFPIETSHCVGSYTPLEEPREHGTKVYVVDKIVVAEKVSLNSKSGVKFDANARASCLKANDSNVAGKANLSIDESGSFKGSNLVIAVRPSLQRLTTFVSVLRPVPGGVKPDTDVTIFSPDEDSVAGNRTFKGKRIPSYLDLVKVTHLDYLQVSGKRGRVKIRVTGNFLDKVPDFPGIVKRCRQTGNEKNIYYLDLSGDLCGLYANDEATVVYVTVEKRPQEEVEEKGLFKYVLRAHRREQVY